MLKVLNQKKNTKKKLEENPEAKREYEKTNVRKILNQKKANRRKVHKKNKKCLTKVERFCQQIKQDPYVIFTLCDRWPF